MSRPPNVLLIVADQHRANALGAYGNDEVRTPHLDRMARGGARYTNCVSVAPICAPYRASLQTGTYPHQHGVTSNGRHLAPDATGIGHDLAARGYDTAYIGKCHWFGTPRPGYVPPEARLGWKRWYGFNRGHFNYDPPLFDEAGEITHGGEGRYEPEWQTDVALRFMRETSHPWALQINFGPPHTATMNHVYAHAEVRERMRQLNDELGFGLPEDELFLRPESWFPQHLLAALVPRRFLEAYAVDDLTLQPNVPAEMAPLARYIYREYYAMVSAVDEQVGRLLGAVDEDTVVIYTSDHGDQLGSHTTLPTRAQHGMPEQGTDVNKGRAKGRPLQNSYRVPLILHGEGIAPGTIVEAPVNTLDLRPTLRRLADGEPHEGAEGASLLPDEVDPDREDVLLGLENWRAIFDGRTFYAAAERDGAVRPHSLVDTHEDPYDLADLVDDPAHTSRRNALHDRLLRRLLATGDPFGGTP